MSKVYFISDLHLGHRKILQFSGQWREGGCVEEHNHILIQKWNSVVRKRDKVFVLGDVVMGPEENLPLLEELAGSKVLLRGNHDLGKLENYSKYFEDIHGVIKYKGFWLSHCPLHPAELRGSRNIHGHVHSSSIRDHYGELDPRYINVCVEATGGYPIPFNLIKEGKYVPRV